MSTVSISYGSIKDSSGEASAVAKKLNEYAGAIEYTVYNKLNNYSGEWSSNLTQAKSNANDKISSLRTMADKYTRYSSDLIDLRDQCEIVDKSVKSKVSSLTATFKENNGIRNSKVENAVSYFFTSIGNSTGFGRWLGDGKDKLKAGSNYLKDSIKEWYNYDGGKELIKGVLIGLLEVAIGVLAIVGAIVTGGALLVIIAGVVGGIIAAANGIANIYNEGKAYSTTQSNDPATGKRRSKIDTWQDYLRSSFIFDDDGTKYEYSEVYNNSALGIDVVNLACTVVTVVSSCGALLKNGYKWATGNATKIKDISLKQVFSKDTLRGFSNRFTDIKATFKANGFAAAKDFGTRLISDVGRNLKSEFLDFDDAKSSIGSIKAMIGIPKDLIKDGFNISNFIDIGVKSLALPALTAFTVNSTDGVLVTGEGGQMQFDFTDKVTIDDIYGIGDKINSKIIGSSIFKDGSTVGSDVVGKLSSVSNINISIPEVNMPNIELPILRAA